MKPLKYTCPKCQGHQYEIGKMYVTGSFITKLLDIQNNKYTTVTCSKCTYTEFYKTDANLLGNVFDFFVG